MKISLDWLSEYVELPDPTEQLIEVLPMLGLEVEEEQDSEISRLDQVVVGEVIEKSPHPEADRLSVCKVEVGLSEPAQIVCGASNFKAGDRVPVALPGASLPGGFKIKKSKLRGVESQGMMCSAKELELGDDDAGLYVLSDRPSVGTPIGEVFSKTRTLELEITANRGDCLSHIGVAREVAAYYDKALRLPEVSTSATATAEVSEGCLLSELRIETEKCPYYTLWSVQGVKIGPSPAWLAERIESIGLRPINNVVDVTNFVLHETGQPLHAFDLAKIKGKSIIVREANEGEKITTLDEQQRTLDSGMMVIADRENPLVVAGIMGSVDAEVDEDTTEIVLESAWFHPGSVRATARALGLHTDSSQRFSRDVDPANVEYAARRAIDLITRIAGGNCSQEFVSLGSPPRSQRSIEITASFVSERCGFEVSEEDLLLKWRRLGFEAREGTPMIVEVPSFRSEVDRPIDLVEEFLRLRGTSDLQSPEFLSPSLHRDNEASHDLCVKAADNLVGQGYQEVCSYSLRSSEELSKWFPNLAPTDLALGNPLTADHTHVRSSLLPGLAEVLAHNQRNLNDLDRVFETGRVFLPGPKGNLELIAISWMHALGTSRRDWKQTDSADFFTLKNSLERVAHATGLSLPRDLWLPYEDATTPWQAGYSAHSGEVRRSKSEISMGVLDLNLTKSYDLKGSVLAVEILIDPILLNKRKKTKIFRKFSAFPPAIKDLSVVVAASEPAETVRQRIESVALTALGKEMQLDPVRIFDQFTGKGLPENMKSIACTLRMRAPDRTLGEKEVNSAFEKILLGIEQDTPYELRK